MTKQGWVAIHRQLQEHWLWSDKPFSKGQAWIDMLLLANHKENKFLFGNELVTVECGSFITSELKLMERWGWGKAKTRNFLNLLQNEGMIIKKSDRKKTTINIVKFSVYSTFENESRPQIDHKQTTNRPQADTNNNDNNENNDNNIKKENIKERKTSAYDKILSNVENDSLRETYLEYIKMRKMIKAPMTDRALTMLIVKVDKLEPHSIDRKKKLLETAILNNWKSVYPLKEEKSKESNHRAYDLEAFERMLNAKDNPPPTAADNPNIKARAEALKKELAEKY